MAVNALQSKLNKALTTNAAGDYALRTQTEGAQTMSSLTMTGDIDNGGNYLLNDQTTTNMMSKGTVYRFDGDNDKIVISDDADIDIGTNDLAIVASFITPDLSVAIPLWYQYEDNDNRIRFRVATDGSLSFFARVGATVVGNYSTAAGTIVADTQYSVAFVSDRDGVKGQFYVNGVAVTTTESTEMAATSLAIAGDVNIGFDPVATEYGNMELASIGLTNFAPTAAEVKSLISGNLKFAWQYGSQTDIFSGYDFTTGADWTAQGGGVADDADTFSSVGAGGIATHVGSAFLIEIGKEYTLTFVSDNQACAIRNGGTEVIGTGDGAYTFTAIATTLYLRLAATGTVNVTTLEVVALGAVALYTQNSMNKEAWVDLANGNDGVITGCELLNISEGQAVNSLVLTPTTVPAAGYEGEIRYNTATNKLNVWTGAAWEAVTSA